MGDRAAVVGAGITGISAAIWLARAGWQVTLIDRGRPGEAQQASYGNAGVLARSSVVPLAMPGLAWQLPRLAADPGGPLFLRRSGLGRLIPWGIALMANATEARARAISAVLARLTTDAIDQHAALAEGTGAERHLRRGEWLWLYRDEAAFRRDARGHALRQAAGFPCRPCDMAALGRADPALGPAIGHAVAYPDHGWITDPGAYLAALGQAFAARGGQIVTAEVVAVAPGRVTLRGGAELAAERIIIAAGIWSRPLAEALGLRVPMISERGYHLMLRNPSAMPPVPCMVAGPRVVATPMEGGLRLAGIVELAATEAPPEEAPVALLRRTLRQVWPGLVWTDEEVWMGHRPSTPDSLPLLGEIPGAPGVICAFGGQHVGLTIGPRLGRMAARIARGLAPDIDPGPLAPGRFARRGRGA
ncbi:MAG: FAD-dependent oxidoreductase [Paracoccaceae bacterium]|nr:MAG: FAD-dependent oxidoreductase [Paracoccaceae bacterium]